MCMYDVMMIVCLYPGPLPDVFIICLPQFNNALDACSLIYRKIVLGSASLSYTRIASLTKSNTVLNIGQKSKADFTVGNILSFNQYFGRHGLPS